MSPRDRNRWNCYWFSPWAGARVKRFREKVKKGEWPDVFIAVHWSRSSRPGVNQFLWGCFSNLQPYPTTQRPSLILSFPQTFVILNFWPILLCSSCAISTDVLNCFLLSLNPPLWLKSNLGDLFLATTEILIIGCQNIILVICSIVNLGSRFTKMLYYCWQFVFVGLWICWSEIEKLWMPPFLLLIYSFLAKIPKCFLLKDKHWGISATSSPV